MVSQVIPNKVVFLFITKSLTEPCKESFLISPYTKKEILEMMSSLDYNKAIGINSIPIKTLKIAKE